MAINKETSWSHDIGFGNIVIVNNNNNNNNNCF